LSSLICCTRRATNHIAPPNTPKRGLISCLGDRSRRGYWVNFRQPMPKKYWLQPVARRIKPLRGSPTWTRATPRTCGRCGATALH